ncbi:hypothetical protein C8J57DRAFT_1527628 [Mycena rebaudengoi]|nr:hypothetical protein C8J57DRAFT_1527628 [Mycena rebaudengoi]
MLDEHVAVFENPQDKYLPVVQRRRSGSSGESKLGNYIVDVFVDVLLTAGFWGSHELPVVAERSLRRSQCWCARHRVHTVGKAVSVGTVCESKTLSVAPSLKQGRQRHKLVEA